MKGCDMGKLHRIKKAFHKLSHDEKIAAGRGWTGVWLYKNEVRFVWSMSYRNYVRSLSREYLRAVAQGD